MNDSSETDLAREDVPLPAAGKTELLGGIRESGGVRHADHQVREGSGKGGVKQIQYNSRAAATKGRAPNPADDDTDAIGLPGARASRLGAGLGLHRT